jgi:aminoglycoside phosphotransferase (APT) family kinase protein
MASVPIWRERIVGALLTETEVFPWAESVLGAKIVASTRQGGRESGGRPGWFITVARGGAQSRYYIRSDRGGDFGYIKYYGLQREVRLLQVLKQEGIPVPEVIASSPDPNAAILEFFDGENDFTLIESAAERDKVAQQFAEFMARWHAIPAERFADIGFKAPSTPAEYITEDLKVWEAGHFPLLKEPVPIVTFACRWLRRNIPEPPARPVLVQGDTGPGQFIWKGGRILTIVDWELASLGDPMRDLAHIRARDVWYPTGNLQHWFKYYSDAAGIPLDHKKISYYTVIAMLTTALALGPVVQNLNPRDEHAEWIGQDMWSKRGTAEALAEVMDIPLAPVTLPQAQSGYVSQLFDVLEDNLREEHLPQLPEGFGQHRMRMTLRLVAHIRNVAEIGREIEEMELADMGEVLGRRPKNAAEGTRAMNDLVLQAGPEDDRMLTEYFYRHSLRQEALMRGGLGRVENAVTSPIV